MNKYTYLIVLCLVLTFSCKTGKKETPEKETEAFFVENLEEQFAKEADAIKSLKEKYPKCYVATYDNGLVRSVAVRSYDLESLPIELRSFRYMNTLSVKDNNLKVLPDWLSELKKLEVLTLSKNTFEALPEILLKCKNLTTIGLNETLLKSFKLDSVLPNLEIVGLKGCPLEAFPIIPQNEDSPPLTLTLSEPPLKAIPKEIANMRLRKLRMIDNQLEYIAPEIGLLKDLENLNLSGSPKLNAQFPEFIGKLENLVYLHLENNLLKEVGANVGNLSKLRFFRLKENRLTTLPKELNQLPHLKYLGLEYNNISEFPPEMFDIKRDTLCNLVLDGNPVRGIPVSDEQFHKGYKMHGED